MTHLSDSDDFLHEPNERPDFRESYYFNWVDLGSGVSGFTTIGLLPNAKKREFVFTLFYGKDLREAYWKEPGGEVPKDLDEALTDGSLSYELIKPMNDWKISYQSKKMSAEILWSGRFPCYDFGRGSGTSWVGHFEQSGKVKGKVTLSDGRQFTINGLGERDKSWGSRDWHIESWYALHAQFDTISIGLRRDYVNGEYHASGGISRKDGHIPITKVDLDTEFLEDRMPHAAETKVYGEDGSCYTLKSKLISDGSYVRFTRDFSGGTTELWEEMAIHECKELDEKGTGLLEWLFTF
ncbi:MAG: hypothetical protein ACFFEF_08885 [Candidatus Thorarchaeota archaeon]